MSSASLLPQFVVARKELTLDLRRELKPVYQTIFGKTNGNCFAACIASILEMDLEDVPHFCRGDNPEWMFDLNEWLYQFGLGALTVAFQDEIPIKKRVGVAQEVTVPRA